MAVSTIDPNGLNIGQIGGFRNTIINGNFDIWQRGTSGSSSAYLADRWLSQLSGSTGSFSRQAFTLGQTDVPDEPSYFHRSVITSSAGASNLATLVQRIEGVRTLAGQTATLSFWAKADATKDIAVEFIQVFGTGGSPSTLVTGIGVTTISLTTSWQKFTVTVAIPSISGKTLGTAGNDYLGLTFWLDAGSDYNARTNSLGQQSGTFDIAQVQLEAGDTATPFEQRSIGQELALCQRYYETGVTGGSGGFQNGTGYTGGTVIYSATKRAVPTLTQSNQGYTQVFSNNIVLGNTGSSGATNVQGFCHHVINGGSATNYVFTYTAVAEL